jgi:hypothetical protein
MTFTAEKAMEGLRQLLIDHATVSGVAAVLAYLYLAWASLLIVRRLSGPKLPPKVHPLLDLPLPVLGSFLNFLVTLTTVPKVGKDSREIPTSFVLCACHVCCL